MLFDANILSEFYAGDELGIFKKKKRRRPPPGPTPQQSEQAMRLADQIEQGINPIRELSNRLAAAGHDAINVDSALAEAEALSDEAREAAQAGNVGHVQNLSRSVSALVQRARSEANRIEARARAEQQREAAELARQQQAEQAEQARANAELQRIQQQQQAEQQRLQQQLSMEQQRANAELQMQQQRMAMELQREQQQQAMLMQSMMPPQPQFPMMPQQPVFLDPYAQAQYGMVQQPPGYGPQQPPQMLPPHMPEAPSAPSPQGYQGYMWSGGSPIEDQMVLLGRDDRGSRTGRLKKAMRRARDQIKAEGRRYQARQAAAAMPPTIQAESMVIDGEEHGGLGAVTVRGHTFTRPANVINPSLPGAVIEYGYKIHGPIGKAKDYQIQRPDGSRFTVNTPRSPQIDPKSKRVVYVPPPAVVRADGTPGTGAVARAAESEGPGFMDWIRSLFDQATPAATSMIEARYGSRRPASPEVASSGPGVGAVLGVLAAGGVAGYVGYRALSGRRRRR